MEPNISDYMEPCSVEMRDLMLYNGRNAMLFPAPNGRPGKTYFSVSPEGDAEPRHVPVEGTIRCAGSCFDRLTVTVESGRKLEHGFPAYILADIREKIKDLKAMEKRSGRPIHPRVVFRDSFIDQPDIMDTYYVKRGDVLHVQTSEGTKRIEVR